MTNKSKKLRNTKMSKKSRKTRGGLNILGDSWTLSKNFVNNNLNTHDGELRKAQKDETGKYLRDKKGNIVVELESDTSGLTKITKPDLVKKITSRLESAYLNSSASIKNEHGYDVKVSQDFPQNWNKKQENIAKASGSVKEKYKELEIDKQKPKQIHGFIPGTTTEGGKFYAIDADNYLSSKFPKEDIIGHIILKYINNEGIKKINEDNEKTIVDKVLDELCIDKGIKNKFTPNYDCVHGLDNCGYGVKTELPIVLSENEKELISERYATSEYADQELGVITGGRKSRKTRRKSNKKRSTKRSRK